MRILARNLGCLRQPTVDGWILPERIQQYERILLKFDDHLTSLAQLLLLEESWPVL
jgi:hypothetical protein